MNNVRTPRFTPAWLCDPTVYSVGEMPPGSDHAFYATPAEMARHESSLVRSLDGAWKAHFARTPGEAPEALLLSDALDATLREIDVPCCFQLVAPEWDAPQYTNVQYPWDGREELAPPDIPEKTNPTVTCVRRFTLSLKDMQHRIMLQLDGVEAAVLVYVNGHEVGYAESSFTPSVFNITGYVRVGENRVALRVFKRCSGSWLEDQDFWRYSGIHRSVKLQFWPECHLADVCVRTPLSEDYTAARLQTRLTVAGHLDGEALLTLRDRGGKLLYEEMKPLRGNPQVSFDAPVEGVSLWSCESPTLYPLTVTLRDAAGRLTEVSRIMVGFRQFEMLEADGMRIMAINGKRIVFHGVNRHEFDCDTGRVMTREKILRDLQLCKQMNINAIRTSHYPNCSWFYRLCDEFGLYVIDENNLETHGTWTAGHPEWVLPGDKEEWQGAVLHRGRAMLERDKNHPCVLMWSCGNESFGGKVIWELSQYFRKADPTRLVHYEGVANDDRYPDTTDVYSRMYCKATDIEKYLKGNPKKPFINCEYTHAMGNSCGGMNEYTALEDKYPMYQGGFIWDFVDQGLRTKGPRGEERFAYGGDFGDRPTDWQFIGNGIVLADRKLSPKAQEVRYLYRDVFLRPGKTGVTIVNRKQFTALDHHVLRWTVENGMKPVRAGEIPLPVIGPGESRHLNLPYGKLPTEGQVVLTCYLVLQEDDGLLDAGTVISHGQTVYGAPAPFVPSNDAPAPVHGMANLGFFTDRLNAMVEYGKGLISLRDRLGREMLLRAPQLSLFRAPTDNDDGNGYATQQGVYHLISRYSRHKGPEITKKPGCTAITYRYETPALPGLVIPVTYTFCTADAVEITVDWPGHPGLPDMPALGMSFQLDPRYDLVNAYGLGPEENYCDRRDGAYLCWHSYPVREGLTPYLNPQESGSRGGVQSLSVTDADQHGLLVMGDALEVSVHAWLPEEVAAARHPSDLTGGVRTVVDVALFRKGVGGDDSWGAPTLPKYCYPADKPYRLTFTLRAL